VQAAPCPRGGEISIGRVHSTSAGGGTVAPAGAAWTTVCGIHTNAVFRGDPIHAALNSARLRRNEICTTDYLPPILVILRYISGTRRVIVDMGGCPGVVLRDGTKLLFTPAGIRQISAAFAKAGG
jgi:hypothetical protein